MIDAAETRNLENDAVLEFGCEFLLKKSRPSRVLEFVFRHAARGRKDDTTRVNLFASIDASQIEQIPAFAVARENVPNADLGGLSLEVDRREVRRNLFYIQRNRRSATARDELRAVRDEAADFGRYIHEREAFSADRAFHRGNLKARRSTLSLYGKGKGGEGSGERESFSHENSFWTQLAEANDELDWASQSVWFRNRDGA